MDRDHVEALFGPGWRLIGTHDVLQLSDHKVPPPIRNAKPTAYHLVKAESRKQPGQTFTRSEATDL
jgi:hypothetical protein